jgi:DNA-binding CsgD family transcriptional regulator
MESRVSPRRLSPFVGRKRELHKISQHMMLVGAGTGTAIAVVGEPGIGKTQLLTELAREHGSEARILSGTCHENQVQPPFHPLKQMLAQYVRELGLSALREAAGTGVRDLSTLVPQIANQRGDAPSPAGRSGAEQRMGIFESIADTLRSISKTAPLILILDNLHRADHETLSFLRYFVTQIATFPVLVCVSYRTTETTESLLLSGLLAELPKVPGYMRIALSGLTREEVGEYVSATLRPEAEEIVDELYRVTEGLPLYVAELVRSWSDRGSLGDRLPEGIVESIRGRLGALDEVSYEILSLGAIVGPSFLANTVLAMAGQSELDKVLNTVAWAVDAGILVEAGPMRFEFAHAFFRQVLLQEMPTAKRLRIHRSLVAIMDDAGQGDDISLLRHARQAIPILPTQEYVEIAIRFAGQAYDSFAFEESLRVAEEALEAVLGDLGVRAATLAELVFLKSRSLAGLGRWEETRLALDDAYDRFEHLGDPDRLVDVATTPVRTEMIGSRELIERALKFAEGARRAQLLCQLGQYLCTWQGVIDDSSFSDDITAARSAYEEAVELARRFDDRATEMWSIGRLGHMLVENWDITGMEMLEEARTISVETGDIRAESWFLNALIWFYMWDTHPPQKAILAAIDRIVDIASIIRSKEVNLQTFGTCGTYLLYIGRIPEGIQAFRQADLAAHGEEGDESLGPLMLTGNNDEVVRASFVINDPLQYNYAVLLPVLLVSAVINRGWSDIVPSLDHIEQFVPADAVEWMRYMIPKLQALASGEPKSCGYLAEEIDLDIGDMEKEGMIPFRLDTTWYRLSALAHAHAGNIPKAENRIDTAISFDREQGYFPDLAYSLRDKARFMETIGRIDDARPYVEEALKIAGDCGLRPLREDCTELLGKMGRPTDAPEKSPPDGLSAREVEVAALLVEGLTNREIGERLYISARTVANHVQSILGKTGSGNRAQAAAYAIRNGLTI